LSWRWGSDGLGAVSTEPEAGGTCGEALRARPQGRNEKHATQWSVEVTTGVSPEPLRSGGAGGVWRSLATATPAQKGEASGRTAASNNTKARSTPKKQDHDRRE